MHTQSRAAGFCCTASSKEKTSKRWEYKRGHGKKEGHYFSHKYSQAVCMGNDPLWYDYTHMEKLLPWVCCVALPCCLFDLACFSLSSFFHLSNMSCITNCQLFPLPCRYIAYQILDPYLTYKIQVDVHQLDHKYSNVTQKNVAYWKLIGSVQIGPSERGAGITDSNSSTPQVI